MGDVVQLRAPVEPGSMRSLISDAISGTLDGLLGEHFNLPVHVAGSVGVPCADAVLSALGALDPGSDPQLVAWHLRTSRTRVAELEDRLRRLADEAVREVCLELTGGTCETPYQAQLLGLEARLVDRLEAFASRTTRGLGS